MHLHTNAHRFCYSVFILKQKELYKNTIPTNYSPLFEFLFQFFKILAMPMSLKNISFDASLSYLTLTSLPRGESIAIYQ